MALPWTLYWERNYFVSHMPWLGVVAMNNYVRGAISGIGFVNVAAGIADIVSLFTRRDHPADGLGPHPW